MPIDTGYVMEASQGGDLKEMYSKKYDQIADTLAKMVANRGKVARQQAADQAAAIKEQEDLARAERLNPQGEAAQGAMLGASVGGPWGALVGGAAGLGVGLYEGFQERKKKKGVWGALKEGFKDISDPRKFTGDSLEVGKQLLGSPAGQAQLVSTGATLAKDIKGRQGPSYGSSSQSQQMQPGMSESDWATVMGAPGAQSTEESFYQGGPKTLPQQSVDLFDDPEELKKQAEYGFYRGG